VRSTRAGTKIAGTVDASTGSHAIDLDRVFVVGHSLGASFAALR